MALHSTLRLSIRYTVQNKRLQVDHCDRHGAERISSQPTAEEYMCTNMNVWRDDSFAPYGSIVTSYTNINSQVERKYIHHFTRSSPYKRGLEIKTTVCRGLRQQYGRTRAITRRQRRIVGPPVAPYGSRKTDHGASVIPRIPTQATMRSAGPDWSTQRVHNERVRQQVTPRTANTKGFPVTHALAQGGDRDHAQCGNGTTTNNDDEGSEGSTRAARGSPAG